MPKEQGRKLVAQNKKARHDYHVEDTYEAGLVLMGTEVKSLRAGRASLVDGFVDIDGHEAWLHGVHIPEYTQGTWTNHAARRKRKLLLNRAEIDKIERKVNEKGLHDRPAVAVLQGRPGQGRDRAGQGQEVLGQAARARRAPGQPREGAGARSPAQGHGLTRWTDEVAQVRAFWQGLGLPGLFDVHVHFLPENVQRRSTRSSTTPARRSAASGRSATAAATRSGSSSCARFGVRRFSALPYAHRPGIAAYLNDWARWLRRAVPECLWSATFYPEPEAPAYVDKLVAAGVEVFKVHVQVGEFHLDDPPLDAVWGLARGRRHAGRGPRRLRPGRQRRSPVRTRCARVLERFPRLTAVVAHMGAPEYAEFLALAERLRERLPGHDHGLHRLLRRARRRTPPSCAPGWWTCRTEGAARQRLPDHPVPLRRTSSRASSGSGWGTTGCARSAGRTARVSSPDGTFAGDLRPCPAGGIAGGRLET